MTRAASRGLRNAVPGVLVVAGGGLAVATWLGGDPGLAVGLAVFYAVAAVVAYVWAGRDSDTAAIMRGSGDERQRSIERDALACTGLVLIVVTIVGAIVSAAVNEGNLGAYGLLAVVGGTSYAISLAFFQRRQ